jgi:hypothetical protein
MSEWNTSGWPTQEQPKQELKAKEHCCEEASLQSYNFYIPCNAPAVNIVGWIGRDDKPIRMCQFCSNHNVQNRGGYVVEAYNSTTGNWPKETLEFDAAMAKSLNPLDAMNEDALLMLWQQKKDAIETAKAEEMELRKYIVRREFPKPVEGTNSKPLGDSGYQLKAVVKYNYNLADNDKVEECLNHISALGNEGPFIADRLVSWSPSFKLVEYRKLCEDKDKGDTRAIKILNIINDMLTISEATPTLDIVAPKAKT